MTGCSACLNGCGGARSDCPMRDWTPEPTGGRPSTYSREMADLICAERAGGKSLKAICEMPGMPPRSTVNGWVINNIDGLSARYAHAREIGLEQMADETLEIADDGRNDTFTTPDGRELTDHDVITRSRLRVDTRKWLLSKLVPKTYGDKIDLNHSGEVNHRTLDNDQLESRLTLLLGKAGIALPAGGAGAPEGAPQALDLLPGPGASEA